MAETSRNYESMSDAPMDKKNGSRREFFSVHVAGITNGAHRPIVRRFTEEGQTEVTSSEQCDYLLVFCPVASRVGTDINEALANIPAAKPVVLVVMHHTFNPRQFVAESSRLVENPNVLTVDCLFHQSELLSCDVNDKMWRDVYNFLEVSQPCCCQTCISWMKNKPTLVCLGFAIMLALVTSIVLFSVLVATHKPLP